MAYNLLIKNALVTSFFSDGYNAVRILEADILIEDGFITKIDRDIRSKAPMLDAEGKMAIPGFVNGRSRLLASVVSAGFAEDRQMTKYGGSPLYTRVNPLINIALNILDKSELESLMESALYRAVRSGTTTLFEHCVGPELPIFLNLAERYGLRAVAAPMLMSRHSLPTADAWGGYDDEIEDTDEDALIKNLAGLIERYSKHPLLTVCAGTGSADVVSESLMRKAAKLARDTNGIAMAPLNETLREVESCIERHGLRPAEVMHKNHLLMEKTLLGGNVYITDEDVAVLKSARSQAVVCQYQAMLDAEVAPFIKFLAADVSTIIGTGRCPADMTKHLNVSVLSGKIESGKRHQMRAQDAFFGSTVGGGRALRIPAGELMEGRFGDVSLVDIRLPHFSPFAMPVYELIYNLSAADITDVAVAGRFIKKDGEVLLSDARDLARKAQAAMEKVWQTARETGVL